MKVIEIFHSIDGEGRRAGELAIFIRLYGCNLRCIYCDTKYSYDQDESTAYTQMSIEDIIKECKKYNTKNITLTGGEPLIHENVDELLKQLSDLNYDVNIETNGSVSIDKYYNDNGLIKDEFKNIWFTIDYKTAASKMEKLMNLDNFKAADHKYTNIVYKFVVGSHEDLVTAKDIINNYILSDENLNNTIYLSPVFGDIEPKEIVEFMQENNLYNTNTPIKCQLQLHKIIWDPELKGV